MKQALSARVTSGKPREKRLTANLYLHWYSLKTDKGPPALVTFNPAAIPTLWPFCLLAARNDPASPLFIADFGAALQADWPQLRRDQAATQVPAATLTGSSLGCVGGVLANHDVVRMEGRFFHLSGHEMLYRAIGLPFLDVHKRLSYVLCAASGKAL